MYIPTDYLYQLVEIHWARGATNGEALAEFLGQDGRSEKQGKYLIIASLRIYYKSQVSYEVCDSSKRPF